MKHDLTCASQPPRGASPPPGRKEALLWCRRCRGRYRGGYRPPPLSGAAASAILMTQCPPRHLLPALCWLCWRSRGDGRSVADAYISCPHCVRQPYPGLLPKPRLSLSLAPGLSSLSHWILGVADSWQESRGRWLCYGSGPMRHAWALVLEKHRLHW